MCKQQMDTGRSVARSKQHTEGVHPAVRELCRAVCERHGCTPDTFSPSTEPGSIQINRDPANILARFYIVRECLATRTPYGNLPSRSEVCAALGLRPSTVATIAAAKQAPRGPEVTSNLGADVA